MNTLIKAEKRPAKENRKKDPYLDRRRPEERREAYSINYFSNAGRERRQDQDRRTPRERREGCVSVSEWSSVCLEENDHPEDKLSLGV
jgi:hypothetical protein